MRKEHFLLLSSKSEVYIYLLSIWYHSFQLSDSGQTFWVSCHNRLTIVCWNFGLFLLTELEELSQVIIFYRTEIRALWFPLQNIIFVVLKPLWNSFGGMFRVIVHLEDPFAPKLWPPGWCLLHDVLSSWCHLFWSASVPPGTKQNTPRTWCYHPRTSQLGWCFQACKLSTFSSKCHNGHHGQTVLVSSDHRTCIQNIRSLSLCVPVIWLF